MACDRHRCPASGVGEYNTRKGNKPTVLVRFRASRHLACTDGRVVPTDWSTAMSTYTAPAVGYLLSEEGHAQLCRLAEHLWLLAELASGYNQLPDSPGPSGVHWAAGLTNIADNLDAVLGSLRWQGEVLEED